MKTKKILLYVIISAFVSITLSSYAIDRKCPAYSQIATETPHQPS
ncbi:MAG: hypothetical protein RR397_03375 [Odoribacter sp.]